MSVKSAVLDRYSDGAKKVQSSLCCPVNYDSKLLEILPQEIIEKDYGCGDPSSYVRPGDTVLDLGSGGGKICYMAAQLVGENGKVIGIDMNDDMLALARKYQPEMAEKLGSDRVQFLKGHIQDLALGIEEIDAYLAEHPIKTADDNDAFMAWQTKQRAEKPMIASESVDLVVSNCVLNLVHDEDKQQLINEIYRVLKPGGRVAISDIVSDETTPQHLREDLELWSGCISGAFQERKFMHAFLNAGFKAVTFDKWDETPWQVVEDIEFRSVILTAIKGDNAKQMDLGHAVIYRGPFSEIIDDEGNHYPRGERMAVSDRTFRLLTGSEEYKDYFIGITPGIMHEARPWCAMTGKHRPVSETRGGKYTGESGGSSCC